MKFGPEGLTFSPPHLSLFPPSAGFVGRQNTIHLLETGLVVEGVMSHLSMLVLDALVRPAVTCWSMVTIPYSCITGHHVATYRSAKVLYWIVLTGLVAFLSLDVETLDHEANRAAAVLLLLGGLLLGVLVHFALRPRHVLTYRAGNGAKGALCFRFSSARIRSEFVRLLEENRQVARTTR